MKLLTLSLLILFAKGALAQDVTPADEKFEDRIARIYQKFNQKEISDDEWGKIAGEKSLETYSLQSGDSLWDISEKFFGNGFYWPKVWQLNDQITNPHMVKVGNTLKFSSGNDVNPPSLEVEQNITQNDTGVDGNDDSVEVTQEGEGSEEVQLETEEQPGVTVKSQVIIPSGKKSVAVLKQIPDSFPEWRETPDDFDENGFAKSSGRDVMPPKSSLYITSVIADSTWNEVGEVSEMEGTQAVAANYQDVVVKLNAPANPGDVFTVFEDSAEVNDPDNDQVVGQEMKIKGIITIKEAVQGAESSYEAIVSHCIAPVLLHDSLLAGNHLIKLETDPEGIPSKVSAKIVDGQNTDRTNYSLHDIVYLDRGEKDGLQKNALLNVYKNYKARNPESKVTFDSKIIGQLKIADVGQNVSTAVIVAQSAALFTGDETAYGPDTEQPADKPAVGTNEDDLQTQP